MKRKIVNKLIILSTLLFGLVGFNKAKLSSNEVLENNPAQKGSLEKPEEPTLVRMLTDDEKYVLTSEVVRELDNVIGVKQEFFGRDYNYHTLTRGTNTMTSETTIYLNAGYTRFQSVRNTVTHLESGAGVELPINMFDETMDVFWKDEVIYTLYCANAFDGNGDRYGFSWNSGVPEGTLPKYVQPLIETGVFDMFGMDCYLDDQNNFHFIIDEPSYDVFSYGEEFYHSHRYRYVDMKISQDFKFQYIFDSTIFREGYFPDTTLRDPKTLLLTLEFERLSTHKYGEKIAMPDLDQKVAEYPESSFMNSTQIKVGRYNCTVNYETGDVTIPDSPGQTNTYEVETLYNKNGSAWGEFYQIGYRLNKNQAIKFSIYYKATALNIGSEMTYEEYTEHVPVSGGISQGLEKYVRYIYKDGETYLIYAPVDPDSAPGSIYIDMGFIYNLAPTLEEGIPGGILTITDTSFELSLAT